MTKQEMINIIEENITSDVLANYLTAEYGETLAIYPNGKISIGQYALEIDPDERPFAVIEASGIGNVDTDYYTRDWTEYDDETSMYRVKEDGRLLDLADCIRDCCENGDVMADVEELKRVLIEQIEIDNV